MKQLLIPINHFFKKISSIHLHQISKTLAIKQIITDLWSS
jgi:hypothetical protein